MEKLQKTVFGTIKTQENYLMEGVLTVGNTFANFGRQILNQLVKKLLHPQVMNSRMNTSIQKMIKLTPIFIRYRVVWENVILGRIVNPLIFSSPQENVIYREIVKKHYHKK